MRGEKEKFSRILEGKSEEGIMFHLIINFCVFVFIFYAVGNSARVILFGSRRKKRAYPHGRSVHIRKAKVIKLNAHTTKRPLRKKPQRLVVFKASPRHFVSGNSPVRGNVAKRQKGCRFRQKKVVFCFAK